LILSVANTTQGRGKMTETRQNEATPINSRTQIGIVLDRSGSMGSIASDTIGGFNQFIKEQKETEGDVTLTLVQFDDQYEILKDMEPIASVADLDGTTYVPRGGTALLDAIGKTINRVEHQISELSEDNKPNKVIFVIITDGEENTSREFSKDNIFEMIRRHESENNWQFVFIGANQDAIAEAGGMGIRAASSLSYGANAGGVRAMYTSMSRNMTNYRTASDNDSYAFCAADRSAQEEHGVVIQEETPDAKEPEVEDTPEDLAFYRSGNTNSS